jgi:hypothetical protein
MLGAAAWTEAMEADGYTCWCHGACGRPHKKTDGACDTHHEHGTLLIAAPEAPTGDMFRDQAAPFLRAWCQPCYDGALRLARRAEAVAPVVAEALFDLPGGVS